MCLGIQNPLSLFGKIARSIPRAIKRCQPVNTRRAALATGPAVLIIPPPAIKSAKRPPPLLFNGPWRPIHGKRKRGMEEDDGHHLGGRPVKRREVYRSLKNTQILEDWEANWRSSSNAYWRQPKATEFPSLKETARREGPKFRLLPRKQPRNARYFHQKYSDFSVDRPSERSGCQSWREIADASFCVSRERFKKPAISPQVAEVGHLDGLKLRRLAKYPWYSHTVFDDLCEYLPHARQAVYNLHASHGAKPGIVHPPALDMMAQLGVKRVGAAAMSGSRNCPKRQRIGEPDPSGRKILAARHLKRERAISRKSRGVQKPPRARHLRLSSRFYDGRGEPRSKLEPHPPANRFESAFDPSCTNAFRPEWVPWPRDLRSDEHKVQTQSPLRSCTGASDD